MKNSNNVKKKKPCICNWCDCEIEKGNEFTVKGRDMSYTLCPNCLKTDLDYAISIPETIPYLKCDCCGSEEAFSCWTGTQSFNLCRKHIISLVNGTLSPADYKKLKKIVDGKDRECTEYYLNGNHYDPDDGFPFNPDYETERYYNKMFGISNQENLVNDMIYHLHTVITDCFEKSDMDREEISIIDNLEEEIEQLLIQIRDNL